MSTYQCPKCFNVLPLSNKILHDLKCTKESPVEFSQENPYTSRLSNTFDYNDIRYSSNDFSNLRISSYFDLASDIRNTAGPMYHKRMSYMNDDGTTTEIKKDTNMAGKEELLEITYDPQGNIIGRKKADGGSSSVKFKFMKVVMSMFKRYQQRKSFINQLKVILWIIVVFLMNMILEVEDIL